MAKVTINASDLITNSRADINSNFTELYDGKEDVANKDTSTSLGTSDTKYPSQNAVKVYVDTQGGANASTTVRGIVEISTQSEFDAGTTTGATGATLVPTSAVIKGSTNPIIRSYLAAASPATWSKPAGLKYVIVEVQGAGGNGANSSGGSSGGGGGAGGYSKKIITAASLGTTETVTIGAAGVGSGNTSFGAHAVAGNGANASTTTGGTGGTASSGDLNVNGQTGDNGSAGSGVMGAGAGGNSFMGSGGSAGSTMTGATISDDGQAGFLGGGGGGATSATDGSPTGSGGAGGIAIVILTEYYS